MLELRDVHKPLMAKLQRFMDEQIYPNEELYVTSPPIHLRSVL